MKNAIMLCSGGLDSITTSYYVKNKLKYNNLIILFFNYGQRTLKQEIKYSRLCAKDLNVKFKEIKLDWLKEISNALFENIKLKKIKTLKNTKKESSKWYFPYRNAVFLISAMAFQESLAIKERKNYDLFVGFKCEGKESYPDTTKKFVNYMNNLAKLSEVSKFRIIAPFIDKDKDEIITLGKKLGVNLANTYSCYLGNNLHCGYCLACKLRQAAFYWANIRDPTIYKKP